MHIEINAGGLGTGLAVGEFQLNMAGFISDAESMISCFKTVQNDALSLSGGVGNLQGAVDEISQRIRQEEDKLDSAITVQNKANDFLELAVRVDQQVASQVRKNKNQFYQKYPHLEPVDSTEEENWGEKAWAWICGAGEYLGEKLEEGWTWVKDTAKKAWDGLVKFYNEHKKIIDTILIVVGAVAAIAAVIASGGTALVPLLGALGMSTGAAIAVSTAVAVVAVVSTVGASTLNIIDTWAEIDDPTFNAWQKGLNITSSVTNFLYSIGNIYNSVKGITPQEYIANHPASNTQAPATTMFDDSVPVAQDKLSSERYFSKGDHYDDFADFWESGGDGYSYVRADNPQTQYVSANDIEGVYLNQSEIDNPAAFWNKRYSKAEYIDYVQSGKIHNRPVEVTQVNDLFYYFEGDGRHRILVAQELGIDIPVIIKGFYKK